MGKGQIEERQQAIIALTDEFCAKQLDEEYGKLAEKLVKKLGRKRSNPLAGGKVEVWAAAVIHALGTINFLFDKSFEPYASVDDINQFFGTNKTTSTSKSKMIRDLLKLRRYDREFSTKAMAGSNPFNDLVMVDGLIVPISALPEELQEIVKQTRAKGGDISFKTR
jgi:hypothetical protein